MDAGEFKPSAPMAPVPGLREEGNVYRPIQRGGRQMTYMERLQDRRAVEEVIFIFSQSTNADLMIENIYLW